MLYERDQGCRISIAVGKARALLAQRAHASRDSRLIYFERVRDFRGAYRCARGNKHEHLEEQQRLAVRIAPIDFDGTEERFK